MQLVRIENGFLQLTLTEYELRALLACLKSSFKTVGEFEYPSLIGTKITEGERIERELRQLMQENAISLY